MQHRDDGGMLDLRNRDRFGQAFGNWLRQRRDRRQALRIVADRLAIIGQRRLQLRLRAERRGPRAGEARLGLRDVGAGDFADVEAVLRLPQLLLQHLDVVAIEIENRRVAQHVHVIADGAEQHVLLGVAQLLARAEHRRFGLAHRIAGAVAVPEVLRHRQAIAARRRLRFEVVATPGPGRTSISCQPPDVAFGGNVRQIARVRLGDVFVLHAHGGALLIDVGVVEIGLGQRAADGLGARAASPATPPITRTIAAPCNQARALVDFATPAIAAPTARSRLRRRPRPCWAVAA